MSLIIKGMEMPKERSLWICIKTDGTVYNIKPGGIGTAHAVGTAIPLPDTHGRLIDVDALEDNAITYYATPISAERVDMVIRLEDLDAAPTIIPSDVQHPY